MAGWRDPGFLRTRSHALAAPAICVSEHQITRRIGQNLANDPVLRREGQVDDDFVDRGTRDAGPVRPTLRVVRRDNMSIDNDRGWRAALVLVMMKQRQHGVDLGGWELGVGDSFMVVRELIAFKIRRKLVQQSLANAEIETLKVMVSLFKP